MISLWVTAENIHHQFYGTTARHQITGNTTSIGSIFQIVPRMYDGFKIKKIFEDKVKKEETNLAIIRADCRYLWHFENNHTRWKYIKKQCDWCLDNHIQPVIDDCWETGEPFVRSYTGWQEQKDYLIKNKIKIISNIPKIHHKFEWDNKEDACFKFDTDDVFVNFDNFFYLTRYQHQMFNNNFKMRTYPTFHKNKKYLFTALTGDILKKRNGVLLGSLFYNNLIDENCFYTSIVGSAVPEKWIAEDHMADIVDKETLHELEEYVNEHKGKILKHKPFEDNYKNIDADVPVLPCQGDKGNDPLFSLDGDVSAPNTNPSINERRIPQELYDSHFSINVETMDHPFFFTEKTFKNVIAKIPFITYGGSYFSAGLKEHHGLERFEEIFDYSYEEIPPKNTRSGKYAKGIVDNIKRLKKEPVSIFSQPSVREKLDYNEYIYFKMTTDIEVQKAVEKLFYEVLK